MLSAKKSTFEKYLIILAHYFPHTNPNVFTILGLFFPIIFFFLLINKQLLIALLVFPGNAFDMLDGAIARLHKKTTKFGAFLDSTCDRISDGVIITAFGFAHIIRWEIIIPLLITSYLISYIRSRAELAAEKKISLAVGIIERTERLIFIFITLLLYTFLPTFRFSYFNIAELLFLILTALSIVTVYQRIEYARRNL